MEGGGGAWAGGFAAIDPRLPLRIPTSVGPRGSTLSSRAGGRRGRGGWGGAGNGTTQKHTPPSRYIVDGIWWMAFGGCDLAKPSKTTSGMRFPSRRRAARAGRAFCAPKVCARQPPSPSLFFGGTIPLSHKTHNTKPKPQIANPSFPTLPPFINSREA